jgi:hypothetical protein
MFRAGTGAVPEKFEEAIPESEIAGVRLRGRVDRVDITPDRARLGDRYKTGSAREVRDAREDPLMGGKKLQLPVYLAAVPDVPDAVALYWFITRKGEFNREVPVEHSGERGTVPPDARGHRAGIRAGAFPAVSGRMTNTGVASRTAATAITRGSVRGGATRSCFQAGRPAMEPWTGVAVAGARTRRDVERAAA